MAAKRAPNRFYNLQRSFLLSFGGFVWRQWKVPTRKERLEPQGKRCAKWKENIVVVMFSFFLFLFLFCCRIEGSKEKTARAILCAGRPCSITPASLSATVQRWWLPVWIGRNCCSRYVECYRELIVKHSVQRGVFGLSAWGFWPSINSRQAHSLSA